jgi:hypothetical protein
MEGGKLGSVMREGKVGEEEEGAWTYEVEGAMEGEREKELDGDGGKEMREVNKGGSMEGRREG